MEERDISRDRIEGERGPKEPRLRRLPRRLPREFGGEEKDDDDRRSSTDSLLGGETKDDDDRLSSADFLLGGETKDRGAGS